MLKNMPSSKRKRAQHYEFAVSACLAGENCNFKGGNYLVGKLRDMVLSKIALPVCPEKLAGLPAPRGPFEIIGGGGRDVLLSNARVLSENGRDATSDFINGAKQALSIIKKHNIKKVILKTKSPSCSCDQIYDGTFSGSLIAGSGVFAQLLIQNEIAVYTQLNYLSGYKSKKSKKRP